MHRRTAAIAIVLALLASVPGVAQTRATFRILETTDVHANLLAFDYYRDSATTDSGLARTATLIARARIEVPNVLLVDNGDLIQGTPLGDFVATHQGRASDAAHPVYRVMNYLQYDLANVGNHEFNYGLEFLNHAISGARFPYINANVVRDDGDGNPGNDAPYFTPYVLLRRDIITDGGTRDTVTVGAIGVVPPQVMAWDRSHLAGTVRVNDMVETVKTYVPRLKAAGAEIIIVVAHSGMGEAGAASMSEDVTYELSRVSDVDAILFGHAHQVFPGEVFSALPGVDLARGTINGVPAVMAGSWGSHLGVIDLQLARDADERWHVVEGRATTRPVAERRNGELVPLVEPDPRVAQLVGNEHAATRAWMSSAVGETSAPIHSYFALVRDDASIQIVTDAQRRYVGRLLRGTKYEGMPILSAGAPFRSGGLGKADDYTFVPAGAIALKHVADLYVFPNTARAVLLDGAGVWEWLEMSAGAFATIDPARRDEQGLINPAFYSFNFDVIDGVTYRIDVTQPARYDPAGVLVRPESRRIVDLRYEGKPIDVTQKFVVATNSYRAGGGGHFPGLDGRNVILEAPDENRAVLRDFIADQRPLRTSPDGNWALTGIKAETLVTFETSAEAARWLTPPLGLDVVGPGRSGFLKYRVRPQ